MKNTGDNENPDRANKVGDLENEKDTVHLIKLHPDASMEISGYLTITQAAEILGIKSRTLRERLRRRRVPVTKIGYFSLIRRDDLERLA
jgi:excisionase family DNA binding protein